jgi:hypothetical protein
MLRIILGGVAGFIGWLILWIGGEKVIGLVWPAFGVHQKAFEDALTNGGSFTADASALATHIVLGSIVSLLAGAVSALVAGENKRAPFFAGVLILAMGVMKAIMSWQLVPVWYHIIFTAMLLPMAVVGGRLLAKRSNSN